MNVRLLSALSLLAIASCDNKSTPEPETTAKPPAPAATATATATATAAETAKPTAKGPFPASTNAAMKDASKAKEQAPAKFKAKFETTAGDFEVECTRDWAPNGVDRFFNLVKIGYFDDVALFRVVKTPRPFVVQFGIHGDPSVNEVWKGANLPPDKPKESNTRGMLTYAMAGQPDTRSTQLFINYGDNSNLDKMGFAPICKVAGSGMDAVEKIEGQYGERPSKQQDEIQSQGNKFLRERFPLLDYIKTARIVDDKASKPAK